MIRVSCGPLAHIRSPESGGCPLTQPFRATLLFHIALPLATRPRVASSILGDDRHAVTVAICSQNLTNGTRPPVIASLPTSAGPSAHNPPCGSRDVRHVDIVQLAITIAALATEFGCSVGVKVERAESAESASSNCGSGTLPARVRRRVTLAICRSLPLNRHG